MEPASASVVAVFALALLGFLVRSTLLVGGATAFLKTRWAQSRRVYARAFGKGQLGSELRAAATVLVVDAVALTSFNAAGGLVSAAPTPVRTLLSFLALGAWFEIWFYVTHRAMHHPRLYRFHAQHHVAKVTHPLTSLSFDALERLVLIVGALGFVALVSRVVPLSIVGIAAYFLANYALNVWAHLNVELMPPGYGRSWMSKLFISTSFHAMHHARYTGHYGLFTTVLDRAFGTAWADAADVQARAATGRGLTTMGERVAPPQ